ncbi:MAG: TolC family protein [Kofleriaceae bacterium]
MSFSRVIELARTRAPSAVIARARIEESRSDLVGARRFATRNPVFEADVGPRRSGDGLSTDVQTSLSFPLDLGGRRDKRVAVVDAEIERERLEAQSVERTAVGAAVSAYYQALHADRRLSLAEDRVRLADAAEVTARQRMRAGDVAEFEVNLARGEVARAKSGVVVARGEQARARAQLAAVLGIPITPVVGDLADRRMLETAGGNARPDLRALAQEIEVSRAEVASARTERWPSLDLRVSYEHERDADIVLGGISIALPVFEHGQGEAARARARGKRAGAELAARTALASAEVESASQTSTAMIAAVRILELEAVPLSIENESAASASYRAGKIDLGALLVIRREALDTRREHLDRLLDAALAAVDLWIARGAPTTRSDPSPIQETP